jgi:hypothetical protein
VEACDFPLGFETAFGELPIVSRVLNSWRVYIGTSCREPLPRYCTGTTEACPITCARFFLQCVNQLSCNNHELLSALQILLPKLTLTT